MSLPVATPCEPETPSLSVGQKDVQGLTHYMSINSKWSVAQTGRKISFFIFGVHFDAGQLVCDARRGGGLHFEANFITAYFEPLK